MHKLKNIAVLVWCLCVFILLGIIGWIGYQDGLHDLTTEAATVAAVPALGEADDSTDDRRQDVGQGDNDLDSQATSASENFSDTLQANSQDGENQLDRVSLEDPFISQLITQVSSTVGCNHGNTLAEVIENLRDEKYEVIVAFSANGQKLFEQTNWSRESAQTQPDQDWLLQIVQGEVFVHNHPGADVPFSSDDLKTLAKYDVGLGLVVTRDAVYSLRPKEQWGDPEEMYSYSANTSILGPAFRQASTDSNHKAIYYATDALLYNVAARFNLEFKRQEFTK